jgi:two-component system, OmpR family, sensor histidine kinase TctE
LLLLAMSLAVVIGLTVALQPIAALARQTEARAPEDHSPLAVTDIPRDIRPLVGAINQQLARTELLATQRRRLIDDASHQLRTPLAILRAQLDFTLRETSPLQQQSALKALSAELDQAIRATNQLLILARQDASRPARETFDLAQLARDVALELLPLARSRDVDLGVDASDTPVQVEGDPVMLHQALANLTHNAIQHGGASGVVTLKAFADAHNAVVQVTDNGTGIEPEVLARLGERFAKGRGSRGSGLGLAIARTAIEHHGGCLRVESSPASPGTCVILQWPRR